MAYTVCTKAHIGATGSELFPAVSPEVCETFPGDVNLSLLALRARVSALVVATKQEHDPITVGVAEDAQEDPFAARLIAGRLAEISKYLGGVVAQAKLEQTVAELLA
jgi:hypothetical protein